MKLATTDGSTDVSQVIAALNWVTEHQVLPNGQRVRVVNLSYGTESVQPYQVDPLAAADMQLLARQTIHAAARAHGLRASFAPLVTPEAAGNGWHAHSSVMRVRTGRPSQKPVRYFTSTP